MPGLILSICRRTFEIHMVRSCVRAALIGTDSSAICTWLLAH